MTDLCCTDDDDRYYDGEDNEDADFDDDNDDYDVLKKVFFQDCHRVFTWLVSEHSCLAFINRKTTMTLGPVQTLNFTCVDQHEKKNVNLKRDKQRIVIINEIRPTREILRSKSK